MSSALPLLWFIAIVAAIPLVLWLLKRTPLGGAATSGAHPMRTVASLAISPSQRILTVEVGHADDRRWLLLGVSPQSISTLYMMLPQDEAAAALAAAGDAGSTRPGFARLLRSLGAKAEQDSAQN
jgi:flagellar protein FliO/FliZ